MNAPVDVSILVVSYRNPELTRACLQSVFDETRDIAFELLVVDNASGDGTPEMVAREFPDVRLVALEENIGFGRANNLAAREAVGEYLLLLNPDTVVHDGAVQRLLAFARVNPEAGLYGGRTLAPDGTVDPSSCWGAPTPWSMACFGLGLSTAFPRSRLLDPESLGRWQRDSVREVGIVTGCLLLMRRDVWHELGGFDPMFFMFAEDADLSMRARRRGWRPTITPEATITHVKGGSSPLHGPKLVLLLRSKVSLMDKHWSPPARRFGVGMLLLGTALRGLGSALLGRLGRPYADPWHHAWTHRDAWRGGYDPIDPAEADESGGANTRGSVGASLPRVTGD